MFVIVGLAVVGVSDLIYGDNSKKGPNSMITGDLLIVMAQIITATQMVVEEKFVSGRNISPLQAVGWEGSYHVQNWFFSSRTHCFLFR